MSNTKTKAQKKTNKPTKTKQTRMNLGDFHSFYLASYLSNHTHKMRPGEVNILIREVEYFANKMLKITSNALHAELRYARYGGTKNVFDMDSFVMAGHKHRISHNKSILNKKFGSFKNFYISRNKKSFSLSGCANLFKTLKWQPCYGGKAWLKIAECAIKIENSIPIFEHSLKQAILLLDHIIDLEHNSDLFLNTYCTFSLPDFLFRKTYHMSQFCFNRAEPSLKILHEKYSGA